QQRRSEPVYTATGFRKPVLMASERAVATGADHPAAPTCRGTQNRHRLAEDATLCGCRCSRSPAAVGLGAHHVPAVAATVLPEVHRRNQGAPETLGRV